MEQNQKIPRNNFTIRTSVYEGPFELALELIEKRKLLVNDLALAVITDEFIEHIRAQETFPVEETAQFIGTAATLLLIKSKSLIPNLTLTEEETDSVEELRQRLALYEHVRMAAREIELLSGKSVLFPCGEHISRPTFTPSRDLSLEALADALVNVLSREVFSSAQLPRAHVRNTVTLEETMAQLTERIRSALTLSFHEFSGLGTHEKADVIISFLALLELVKQGAIKAAQYDLYSDIQMENTTTDAVPHYNIT